jgi:Arm DNA-binding domain/Phage integrase family
LFAVAPKSRKLKAKFKAKKREWSVARLLTDKGVSRLRVRRKPYTIWDSGAVGLGLRVTPRGKKVWLVNLRFPGQRTQAKRRLGVYSTSTLGVEAAREKAREWYGSVKGGTDPKVAEREAKRAREAEQRAAALKDKNTFAACAERYLAERTKNRRIKKDRADLERLVIPAWGNRPIHTITARDVRTLFAELKERTPHGARAVWQHVTAIFAAAEFDELIPASPISAGAKKLIFRNVKFLPRQRVLGDTEIFALWRATSRLKLYRPVRVKGIVREWTIDPDHDAPAASFYRLLLLTAARKMELLGAARTELHPEMRRVINEAAKTGKPVNWSAVPVEWKSLTVPRERFKSDAEHIVPLVDEACRIIERLPNTGKFLFSYSDKSQPGWLGSKWKRRLDERMLLTLKALARERGDDPATVKLQAWVNHDLRRVVRSNLSALGIPDHIAEAVLGHGRKGLARVYDQHKYLPEVRAALEAWAVKLQSIVAPTPPPKRTNVVPLRKRGRARS